jgi:molecular chaperone DnaK (HSP70)
MRYGFDFGTTNSSISLLSNGEPQLISVDKKSSDSTIIRSLLYFFHRELVAKEKKFGQFEYTYKGDFKFTFGQEALENYIKDNTNRAPGKVVQFFTGRTTQTNPLVMEDSGPATEVITPRGTSSPS